MTEMQNIATATDPISAVEMAAGMFRIARDAGYSGGAAFAAVRCGITGSVEVGMWPASYGAEVRAALDEIELIEQAREWVSECTWADIAEPADVDDLTDDEIKRGVEQHYDGGWQGFVRDCQ